MKNREISAFLFLLLGGMLSYSQDLSLPSEEYRESLQVFDKIVGIENTGIYDGIEYIEKQRMINEKQKFLNSFDFETGTVFYEGQPYFNIPLKYNVPEDLVLVRLEGSRGSNIIQLHNNKLDGFIVGTRQFINFTRQDALPLQGIFEVIMEASGMKLLKKHHMKSKKVLSQKLVNYEFETDDPEYFYLFKDQVMEMERQTLLDHFENDRKEIRQYYRSYTKSLKDNPDFFMKGLFQLLNEVPE